MLQSLRSLPFRTKATYAAVCICLLTFAVYTPSLGNAFVTFDDTLLITRNPNVQGLSPRHVSAVFTSFDPELYIPLTLLSYQIEVSLFGLRPFVFHVVNLLLHLGSVSMLFVIVLMLTRRFDERSRLFVATFITVVFALHPMNTQVVAWAAARKDVLSSFFFLGSVLLYLLSRERNFQRFYWGSVVAFFLALLSKVSIVVLPIVLLLIDELLRRKRDRRMFTEKVPYFLLSVAFGVVALIGKTRQIASITPVEEFLLSLKSIAFYVRKLFVPTGLNIFHPQETPATLSSLEFFLPFLLVLVLLVLAAVTYRKNREVWFGILFFLLLLVPSFFSFWKNGFLYYADERYGYLAMIGMVFALGCMVIPPLLRRAEAPRTAVATVIVLLGFTLAGGAYAQSRTWKNSEVLYSRAIAFNPRSAHAMNNLGSTYFEDGRLDEAMAMYLRAVEADPSIPQVYANIGKLFYRQGKLEEAQEWFQRSVEARHPRRDLLEEDLVGYYFLGALLEERGDIEGAIAQFRKAAEEGPMFAASHLNLGILLQKYRRLPEAMSAFRNVLELDERNIDAHYRLAAVLAETGSFAEAIEHLEYVVSRDPDYESASMHLENLRLLMRSGA